MRHLLPAIAAAVLAACTAQPPTPAEQAARADREANLAEQEARELAGLAPDTPVDCISTNQARETRTIGERTILYRVGVNLVYRNDPVNGCAGMGPNSYIVTRTPSTRLCRGDIVQVVDSGTNFPRGGCSLSEFVPYRRQGG